LLIYTSSEESNQSHRSYISSSQNPSTIVPTHDLSINRLTMQPMFFDAFKASLNLKFTTYNTLVFFFLNFIINTLIEMDDHQIRKLM